VEIKKNTSSLHAVAAPDSLAVAARHFAALAPVLAGGVKTLASSRVRAGRAVGISANHRHISSIHWRKYLQYHNTGPRTNVCSCSVNNQCKPWKRGSKI
jgi:hypothetical protein